jgi:hypothetical protein
MLEVLGPLINKLERIFQHDNNTPRNQTRVGSEQDLP